jgi:Dehydrogenase E1 component
VPVGAGLGLAHKLKGDGHCAFALYGDGAANQGQIAEAMNTSALWGVPIIFVCENNHYGMGTAEWRGSKSPKFYTRGDYVPGIRVDGMDVLAVKRATEWAKKYVLENGPLCFEADTYRCAAAARNYMKRVPACHSSRDLSDCGLTVSKVPVLSLHSATCNCRGHKARADAVAARAGTTATQ